MANPEPIRARIGRLEHFGCSNFLTLAVPGNWKFVVDAFVETYHQHAVHRQMLATADDVQ